MGKRKSSKKPQTRVKQVLDKSFRCIFCAHQGSVTCKMDNKLHVGRLDCKDCNVSFSMDISHLDAPVDVYSSWIDAASEANSGGARTAASSSGLQRQNDDDSGAARRPAAAASRTPKSQPKKKRTRDRDSDDEADSDEDDAEFDPVKSKKKGKRSAPSDVDDDDDDEEEEEAVESDQDLPNLDISRDQGKKPVKRGKVVDDEEEDD